LKDRKPRDEEDPTAWWNPPRKPAARSNTIIARNRHRDVCSYCNSRPAKFEVRYKTGRKEQYQTGNLCQTCVSIMENAADKDVIVLKVLEGRDE
jgi:hypothetical protein